MNIDSSGHPDSSVESTGETQSNQRRPWLTIVVGVVAILFAIYIGTNVIGVLYSILFPASAPLPANVTEVEHENLAYGVDEWVYATHTEACDVVQFYIDQGGQCRIPPGTCSEQRITFTPGQNVGQCTGEVYFSIFAMRWDVTIAGGYRDDIGQTRFRLSREIFWGGGIPEPMELPAQ